MESDSIILVTGRNGQLGFELTRALAPLGRVHAVGQSDCDLSNGDAIRNLLRRIRPNIIVNPAAYTAVDKAESDYEAAHAVNADAVRIIGEEADRLGAFVIHYSTDYVFDGKKNDPYSELDLPAPQSVYGRTKYQGELDLASATPRHLILRTSWVVGAHGGNFAKTMLRLAGERDCLSVVGDQFGTPTSASLLADITSHLVRQFQMQGATSFPYGTYHVTADGDTNWADYARFVIDEAVHAGKELQATSKSVLTITTDQYPTAARRPVNSRMDTSLFRRTFGLHLPRWQEGVRNVLQQII